MIGFAVKLVGIAVIGTLAVYGCNSLAQGSGPEPVVLALSNLNTQHTTTVFNPATGKRTTTFARNLNTAQGSRWLPADLAFTSEQRITRGVHQLGATETFTSKGSNIAQGKLTRDALELVHPKTGVGIRWLLPAPARVEVDPAIPADRNKVSFINRGIIWEIHNTPNGSKLLGSVAAPKGPQTYTFGYQLVNTEKPLAQEGNRVVGDGFVLPPPEVIDAGGKRYPINVALNDAQLIYSFDDRGIPLTSFPYVIDPTVSFDIEASPNDVSILCEGGTYPPDCSTTFTVQDTATSVIVKRSCDVGPIYSQRAALLSWDTSVLPTGATIDTAAVILEVGTITDTDSMNLVGEWYEDSPPFTTADYTNFAATTAANVSLASLSASTSNTVPLTGVANVNTDGFTTLRFTLNNAEPPCNNQNDIAWESFDNAGTAEPRLTIEYTSLLDDTTPSLGSYRPITAYRGLLEATDILMLVPYTINTPTAGVPDELASAEYQFIFRDGTSWFQVTYPVVTSDNGNRGYKQGLSAFYFSAAQVAALGLTWNSPGTYTIELDAINGSQNTTTGNINWRSASNQDLESDLSAIATSLEGFWSVNLIQDGRLTTTGQSYFASVIPGIARMLPQFAALAVDRSNPTVANQGTTGSAAAAAFWDGTQVATAFETLATRWGMTAMQLKTVFALMAAAAVVIIGILVPKVPSNIAVMAGGVVLIVLPAFAMGPQVMSLILGFIGLALGVYAWQWGRGTAN